MREYLDAMDRAPFMAATPSVPAERVIGALHPKMLALAAERTAGAHPYFTPPEHTARARKILGAGKLLAPEQAVILDTDATRAREVARTYMRTYLGLPNYVRNLLTLGFTDADVADGGSDRLVDAIVAWGDERAIAARVRAHLDAGADHVCVQVLDPDPREAPVRQWRALAGELL
jgi:probable F420-dependent oxidoreductase